jgi:hypothetical protein
MQPRKEKGTKDIMESAVLAQTNDAASNQVVVVSRERTAVWLRWLHTKPVGAAAAPGPHDLVQMARRGQRLYWAGAETKIYEQPKRLERLGYLVSEKRPGKTRERTDYRLTEKGINALREWLARPTHFPHSQSEAADLLPARVDRLGRGFL